MGLGDSNCIFYLYFFSSYLDVFLNSSASSISLLLYYSVAPRMISFFPAALLLDCSNCTCGW